MEIPLIRFEDVKKQFSGKPVLDGVNLSIFKGEITTIIGKSGMGKSVLLKHIVGLMNHDSGNILYNGRTMTDMTQAERKSLKKKFSYMFQGNALFDSMTVLDNIALPLRERTRFSKKDIVARVEDKMDQLDLGDISDRYPSQLSGGMQKRVALARALITDPEIVLFDEPTTGLDPVRKNAVHSMIDDYQKRFGFTGVVVSHEIPDIFFISQRVAMLDEGKILFENDPVDIGSIKDPIVRAFIKGLESKGEDYSGVVTQPQSERRFRELMARMERHDVTFSLILLSVENFDEVNQEIGHEAGHSALNRFSLEVKKLLRMTDVCSRYDINKLMVVLPDTGMEAAKRVCDKLVMEMSKKSSSDNGHICLYVTAGFAEAQKDSQVEHLLASAESRQNTYYEFEIKNKPLEE